MNESLLHHKSTIIYGAGGGIGSGVAVEFARQGARLFLAGRTREQAAYRRRISACV